MKVTRVKAVQAHAVPKTVHAPRGPFPPEMQGFNPRYMELSVDGADYSTIEVDDEDAHPAAQPEIVTDYMPEQNADGYGFEPGATAQNNFRPEKYYRCRHCDFRLQAHELDDHECDD